MTKRYETYTWGSWRASGLREGAVVADMRTIAPRTVREILPAVESRHALLVDAPVSGSVAFAERGELTIMVGGEKRALEDARLVLDALSSRLFHVGGIGTGATMKLAVNALLHGLNLALCEALVLAERAGVERSAAYDVFASSVVGAPFLTTSVRHLNPRRDPGRIQLGAFGKGPGPDSRFGQRRAFA
jgi:3-hydroxyisobutyrate dehydrogenase/2-hydroxy-3-oxopropionate reductase